MNYVKRYAQAIQKIYGTTFDPICYGEVSNLLRTDLNVVDTTGKSQSP